MPKKWVRSENGILAGVFEGLGESFGLNPIALRLVWLISVLFFGSGILFYLILWLVLPKRSELDDYYESKMLGVCFKIADYYSIDLGMVRLLFIASLFLSAGISFLIYLVLWVIFPKPSKKLYY